MTELAEKLAQPLDAARIKSRPNGRGGQLSYLETHDVIRAANEIFGFGKWGHEVTELRQLDAVTVHNSDSKAGWCVGYVCVVKLTVDGCVPVSGVGFGDGTEYRESALVTAHELAAKEAESDALKRALKNYGDQFGLALYDKDAAKSGHVTGASTGRPSTKLITEPQRKRLFALAKEAAVGNDVLKQLIVQVTGQDSTEAVPVAKYDELCGLVEAGGVPF